MSLQNKIYLQRIIQNLNEANWLSPTPPQQSPWPPETPAEENPFQEYWPLRPPKKVPHRPDFTPHDEIPGGAGGGMSEKQLLKLIWWLIHQKTSLLDDNFLGRLYLGLPEPPSDACRADPVCYQEYLDALWAWLEDALGDALQDYWDEYQDWLEDHPGSSFWDWLLAIDWGQMFY